jgi:hypothetical protein
MIVKTKLSEIQDEFSNKVETVSLGGHGLSSFLYLANKGRAVEISEDNGDLWLEFWEKSDDEDAGPVKELTVATSEDAIRATRQWLE